MLKKLLLSIFLYSSTMNVTNAYYTPYIGGALGAQFMGDYIGLMANWYAGVGTALGCVNYYYIGGELFGDFPSASLAGSQRRRILYDVGIAALGGIYISQFYMLYAKIGIQKSWIKRNDDVTYGGLLGLGLQAALNETLDVRAEYVYVGQDTFSNLFSVRANNARVGLVYKFF